MTAEQRVAMWDRRDGTRADSWVDETVDGRECEMVDKMAGGKVAEMVDQLGDVKVDWLAEPEVDALAEQKVRMSVVGTADKWGDVTAD